MKQLTEYQINFILDKFFPTYDYAGAKEVGYKLLTNGRCTVAGTRAIHLFGVTPYIHTEKVEDLVDCLNYTFDLEGFLNSTFFKGTLDIQKKKYKDKKVKLKEDFKKNLFNLNREYEDICKF